MTILDFLNSLKGRKFVGIYRMHSILDMVDDIYSYPLYYDTKDNLLKTLPEEALSTEVVRCFDEPDRTEAFVDYRTNLPPWVEDLLNDKNKLRDYINGKEVKLLNI